MGEVSVRRESNKNKNYNRIKQVSAIITYKTILEQRKRILICNLFAGEALAQLIFTFI